LDRPPEGFIMTGEVLMRLWVAAAAAGVIAAFVASTAGAQSLAEIAERNKKKEAAKGKPAAPKVYTEDDLRAGKAGSGSMSSMDGPVAVAASPAPGSAPPAPGAAAAKSEDEVRAEAEAEWRQRLQQANEDVTRIAGEVDRAQSGLNDLSGPLYGGSRTALLNRLEEGQRNLAAARKKVEDLQEEGRRARYR
jgi:hypothetical protein